MNGRYSASGEKVEIMPALVTSEVIEDILREKLLAQGFMADIVKLIDDAAFDAKLGTNSN